jgi:hypothetical protein
VKEAIANLRNNSGYQALLEELDDYVESLQEQIADPGLLNEHLLLLTRHWQATKRIVRVLHELPEDIGCQIDKLLEEAPADPYLDRAFCRHNPVN